MTTIKCAAGCGNNVEVKPSDEGMDHLCDTCAPEQCKRASCHRREEQMRARIAEQAERIEDLQVLASQINTDWIPANKQLCNRIAELEDALRGSMEELNGVLSGKYSGNAYQAIAKIKEFLGGEK